MPFPSMPSFQNQSAEAAYAVVPSDTTANGVPWKMLYVGGAGNVTMVDMSGNTVVFSALPVGTQLLMAGKLVKATGTTATLLVAMV